MDLTLYIVTQLGHRTTFKKTRTPIASLCFSLQKKKEFLCFWNGKRQKITSLPHTLSLLPIGRCSPMVFSPPAHSKLATKAPLLPWPSPTTALSGLRLTILSPYSPIFSHVLDRRRHLRSAPDRRRHLWSAPDRRSGCCPHVPAEITTAFAFGPGRC